MRFVALIALLVSMALHVLPLFGVYLTLIPLAMAVWVRDRGVVPAALTIASNLFNITLSPVLRTNAFVGLERGEVKWMVFFLGLIGLHLLAATLLFLRNRAPQQPG